MKKRRVFCQILAIALCLALLCPLTAFADGEGSDAAPADPESYAVIDPEAMKELVETYASAKKYDPDLISVGYCYLDTGDTWYFNGDKWNFGAGVYYVPLMMILAEREHDGRMTQDSDIGGLRLSEAESLVLIDSDNTTAHKMINAIGTDREVRKLYRNYSPLPEDYYDPDFLDYSYFSVHFLTDVMKTLYYENERFPNIVECLKQSDTDKHFHGALEGEYEVAQKYGNFIDRRGVEYNNCTGIIYTGHPFILAVMTKNMGITQEVMRDMAIIFKDYTLSLDESYAARESGSTEEPTAAPAQEEAPVVPAPEQEGTETEAPGTLVEIPEAPAEEQPAGETGEEGVIAADAGDREVNPSNARRMVVLILCAAALVVLCLAAVLKPILRKRNRSDMD